ncbi:MAG: S-methyl-5-thioribose-1-phosphate isomerase, partial [Bacteroidota bacterium]
VALPSSTIDWGLRDGIAEIPIETRSAKEISHIQGWNEASGKMTTVRLAPPDSHCLNYGFDVTPARYVSALITERGVCPATEDGLLTLFPEQRK